MEGGGPREPCRLKERSSLLEAVVEGGGPRESCRLKDPLTASSLPEGVVEGGGGGLLPLNAVPLPV